MFCRGQDAEGYCIAFGIGPIRDEGVCETCRSVGGFAKAGVQRSRPCEWMEKTTERPHWRPCKGVFIVCRNPASPICGHERVRTECDCKQSKCRFFK